MSKLIESLFIENKKLTRTGTKKVVKEAKGFVPTGWSADELSLEKLASEYGIFGLIPFKDGKGPYVCFIDDELCGYAGLFEEESSDAYGFVVVTDDTGETVAVQEFTDYDDAKSYMEALYDDYSRDWGLEESVVNEGLSDKLKDFKKSMQKKKSEKDQAKFKKDREDRKAKASEYLNKVYQNSLNRMKNGMKSTQVRKIIDDQASRYKLDKKEKEELMKQVISKLSRSGLYDMKSGVFTGDIKHESVRVVKEAYIDGYEKRDLLKYNDKIVDAGCFIIHDGKGAFGVAGSEEALRNLFSIDEGPFRSSYWRYMNDLPDDYRSDGFRKYFAESKKRVKEATPGTYKHSLGLTRNYEFRVSYESDSVLDEAQDEFIQEVLNLVSIDGIEDIVKR